MKTAPKTPARIFPVIFSLPFILFVFLLVSAGCFLLLTETVTDIFSDAFFHSPRAFFLLVVTPVALIILAAFLFYGLASEIFRTGAVHTGGFRVFQAVCVFTALLSLLFCLFSSRFIGGLFSVYNDSSIEASLASTARTTETYVKTRHTQLQTVARKFLTGLNIGNHRVNPRQWMHEIRDFDPDALAVQIYLAGTETDGTVRYSPVKEEGDSSVFESPDKIAAMENGISRLEALTETGGETADNTAAAEGAEPESGSAGGETKRACIHMKGTARYAGNNYIYLYTSAFPEEILEANERTLETLSHISKLKKLAPVAPYLGVWLFSGFILPPVLFLLLAAFYLCVRLSDPLATLNRVCAGLSRGEAETSVISHRLHGLAETVALVNTVSETMQAGRNARKDSPAHTADTANADEESAARREDAARKEEADGE